MKLPWYIKSFYDAEKKCYILKVNKWWAFWRFIQIHLFLRWIRKNTYPYNFYNISQEVVIEDASKYWDIPKQSDDNDLKHHQACT